MALPKETPVKAGSKSSVAAAALSDPIGSIVRFQTHVKSAYHLKPADYALPVKRPEQLLEQFLDQPMQVRCLNWLGWERSIETRPRWMEKQIGMSNLRICTSAYTGTTSSSTADDTTATEAAKQWRGLYIDWDDLQRSRPKFWFALHSCIPWADFNGGSSIIRNNAVK